MIAKGLIAVAAAAVALAFTLPHQAPRKPATFSACSLLEASNVPFPKLHLATAQASVIVVGQVTAVAQYPAIRTVEDFTAPQQRLYTVTVEQVLKDMAPFRTAPGTIQVVAFDGADRPQHYDRLPGRPWLLPGNRYILFLYGDTLVDAHLDHPMVIGGDETGLDGPSGPSRAYSDYVLYDAIQGVVLLSGGQALPNADGVETAAPEPFQDLPLFGISEAQAIANVQEALAQNAIDQTPSEANGDETPP